MCHANRMYLYLSDIGKVDEHTGKVFSSSSMHSLMQHRQLCFIHLALIMYTWVSAMETMKGKIKLHGWSVYKVEKENGAKKGKLRERELVLV